MKILIADSGSTKTDWALVDEQGNVMVTCKTQGISPIHQSDAEILDVLCKELVLSEQPQEVFFYGSGVTEAMKSRMKSLLQQSFPEAKVEAEGDMLGAARALFGKKPRGKSRRDFLLCGPVCINTGIACPFLCRNERSQ